MGRPVIVLELNELTPALMDRFIAGGHLPGFAKLRSESIACTTDSEEVAPYLEPWIQWVTVHTGRAYKEHGVFQLGDGSRYPAPRVWDLVADAGEGAWVCGSMNAAINAADKDRLFVLPDPWSVDIDPYPRGGFEAYLGLVKTFVQEYTRDSPPLKPSDYVRFARFMFGHGLSARTMVDTIGQLAGERVGGAKWKRATILDRLQWDVFRHVYRRVRPRFSTYFVNSTAHFQHYYWREMDPELFELKDNKTDEKGLSGAILHGYKKMDRIVSECLELAGDEATVVLCTALGAQPMLKYDADGGWQITRPIDIDDLLAYLGVTQRREYAPAMSEKFFLTFESEADAVAAQAAMEALKLADGRQVLYVEREGPRLECGVQLLSMPPEGTRVETPFSNQARLFDQLFYPAQGVKSGMHHPEGLLWIRTPARKHMAVKRKVKLREIAPTLLALAGIKSAHPFDLPAMAELAGLGQDAVNTPA